MREAASVSANARGGRLWSGVERWDIAEISAWFGSRVHTEPSSLALAISPLLIPRPLLHRHLSALHFSFTLSIVLAVIGDASRLSSLLNRPFLFQIADCMRAYILPASPRTASKSIRLILGLTGITLTTECQNSPAIPLGMLPSISLHRPR